MSDDRFSNAWRAWRASVDLDEYESRWERLEAAGEDVHGEADFVCRYEVSSVLDAGCGMGRVAIELDTRGMHVVGVDQDPDLLARAHRRAPQVTWVNADLAQLDLGREFDVVVMAGNVLPFAVPSDRSAIVAACARHLDAAGRLIVGAGLSETWPTAADLDEWCANADLALVERYGGWQLEPWRPHLEPQYVVSVYQRTGAPVTSRSGLQ